MADEAARAAAHRLRVPARDRAARCQDLHALAVVHDVFAAVEVAAFAAERGCTRRRFPRTEQHVRRLRAAVASTVRSHWAAAAATPPWRLCWGRGVTARSPGLYIRVRRAAGQSAARRFLATPCCADVLFGPAGHVPKRLS